MSYLLDTQALIWFFEGNLRLPQPIRQLIEDSDTEICVSIASFWEIAIKVGLGKLTLAQSLAEIMERAKNENIDILPIDPVHVLKLLELETHHKDPFDRIIIAQAMSANLDVISSDDIFRLYPISIVW